MKETGSIINGRAMAFRYINQEIDMKASGMLMNAQGKEFFFKDLIVTKVFGKMINVMVKDTSS